MAVLPDEDRRRTWAHIMRNTSAGTSVTKLDLRAAVDAADSWIDGAQASYNSALPQPFRSSATTTQKAVLLCYVIMRRVGILRTDEDG